MKFQFVFIPIIISVLFGCATEKELLRKKVETNICDFSQSRPNTIISHVDNRGGIVQGDIKSLAIYNSKRIATVLATTKRSTLRQSRAGVGYCCQWSIYGYWCGYQYCSSVDEHDLSEVYGLARAPDMEQAKEMAIENCESAAGQFADTVGTSRSRSALECKVHIANWCD